MSRSLRILFMGTPDFAVSSLQSLYTNNYDIVAVVTAPDRPAGRGQKLKESPVKVYAKRKGLTVLQPERLKNERFILAIKALDPNVQVVVAFRMLPQMVWNIPEYGTFNLHASLLPDYRGAAPINWAIINGETKTGVTTFFIDEKIDTGEIIFQKETEISSEDTAGSLHDKLMVLGSDLVLKTIRHIETNEIQTTKQSDKLAINPAPKLNRDNCKIDWNDTIVDIYNKIRGLSPYPVAWSEMQNGQERISVKIYSAVMHLETHDESPGTLKISKNEMLVAVKKGYLKLLEIQLPGKRRMDIKSLLNGFSFHKDVKML
ncbi:MAG: methionyl-tRNA formyltransferase [Bacteroidia bacterium]|nr:methionyl-tRNA formyltransferase [Bacteroidia bacterium]MBT8278402.1 methionyl-tRNA formyltransferase [Bacteroidia bacterium]NNK60575.1 methionyl-tRNA formyltransferase [Flavobacteriaceae bacterium]NNL31594.1 methionyl-tRNA formyltransferase [Flavobacteriaceae bacterium]